MGIALLTTGGTIDKVYFNRGGAYEIGEPVADQLLNDGRVADITDVVNVMRKDSLDITDVDRALIRRAVLECASAQIIITHGTDSMPETARALAGVPAKTIVLTGAFQPARFRDSDAAFNLGMAVATARIAPHGVYIVAHGDVFDARNVRKNVALDRFERIDPGCASLGTPSS